MTIPYLVKFHENYQKRLTDCRKYGSAFVEIPGGNPPQWKVISSNLNPIDPNPAISARVVFPQSGHIRPEKRLFFRKFPHFSKIEPYIKYEPLIGVQYIVLKPMENSISCRRNHLIHK